MKNIKFNKASLVVFIFLIMGMALQAAPITVNTSTVVNTNTCDKISWTDSSGLARTASIVKYAGNPNGFKGGYLSQFTYMDGAMVTCNESNPASDLSGLGFMINHQPTGYAGRGWANSKQDGFNGTTSIVFQGANHVIYETEMDMYGDNGNTAKGAWKVKWQYMIRTGNDYIVDAISYDFSSKPFGTYGNDIRSPYCEMNWTGTGAANTLSEAIDGIEFCATNNAGLSYIFKTVGSSPFSAGYTFNTPGRNIPYTLQWKNAPDREAGYVSTLDLTQFAAGGGYLSAPVNIGATGAAMPPNWGINYQSNGFQGWYGDKMTWALPYGAAGGETAAESGSTTMSTFPDWTWRKNWKAYPVVGFTLLINIGKKTADGTRILMNEEADIHGLAVNALSASTGTVVTTGKQSLYDAATFTYKPAGYNHMYHTWEVNCSADTANVTLTLGAVSLKNQTFVFNNYNGASLPAVTVNGTTQIEGTDMYASLDTVNKKIYVTFNKTFTGATIIAIGSAGTATVTPTRTVFVSPTNSPFVTPTMTPTLGSGGNCINLRIDRTGVPAMAFMKNLTLKVHVGDCVSVTVTVDGITVPSTYNAATKICMFTTTGNDVVINRSGYSGGATNAVTKATLMNDKKWAYSFTFDDGMPSCKTIAMPVLDLYGYVAGAALNTQQMQETNEFWPMSWQSADVLRAKGWSFFDHNYTHLAATCANINTETVPVKTAIEARWPGYKCTHFVYPYTTTTDWACIRDSGLFLSAEVFNGNNYADTLATSPFLLNRNSMMAAGNAGTTSLANALADNAAADARPRWLIMFTHAMSAGSTAPASTYDTNEATFAAHIAYIYNTYGAGGLDNMWFAPSDVVMHYMVTRDNATVNFLGSGVCGAVTPATPTMTSTPLGPTATFTITPPVSDCLLDDMEDNNTQNKFNGFWFSFAAGTGASVVPAAFAMASGGYSSLYAARLNGFVGTAAANSQIAMATQLDPMAAAPANGGTGKVTDISGCGGISFWAKGDGKQYHVKIPYTDVNDGSLTGWDDYKAVFTAPVGWTLVTIPFTSFAQAGWGTLVSRTTVLQNAKQFQFVNAFNAPSGTTTVDLWVDNLYITACGVCPGAAIATATRTNTTIITATNTPVNTATYTRTASATSSNTVLPTATLTPTFSFTITGTQTGSATATKTNTPVLTATNTFTLTFTNTPTNTRTSTPTRTMTGTPTSTRTITSTFTDTPVYSPTLTMTGTPPTSTDTPTLTMTETLTSTETDLPTETFTPTFTATAMSTASFTHTASPSATGTVTLTPYNTFTNTPVNTATNTSVLTSTSTPVSTPANTGISTAVNTPSMTQTATKLPTGTFTSTAISTVTRTSTAVNTATFTSTRTAVNTATKTPSITVTSTMTSTLISTAVPSATATQTSTPLPTATIAWGDKFEITDALIYPNPCNPEYVDLKMKITLTQAASEMKVRIYSVSYRRVLETECGAVNTKEVTVIITRDKIARLAAGTYFMVVSGKSNGGEKAVSKPQELIILK